MKHITLIGIRVAYQWLRHHVVFVVPLALLEREFLDIVRDTYSHEL